MKFHDLGYQILSKYHEMLTVEPLNTSNTILKFSEFSDMLGLLVIFKLFVQNYRNAIFGSFAFFSSSFHSNFF